MLTALIIIVVAAAYVNKPVKGEDTSKQQLYVRVFYCFDSQSVQKQRQSEKHKIVAGYVLSSIDPNSDQMKTCAKDGVPMIGYVQVTPPLTSPDETASIRN
jgi:hypothetical protein